ncbi:uncharacterized protein FPRO_11333 [Fusarium proliferatum ET1]|uniref:Uncharacterized protein n=1 Tax=Fusarium proliferatum (strain ET1) TaxID=1227346 RepID=A0A1L7VML8_FUSPR|nr:uncharacterized protein FPRO_11333 [Fusarium proliferatum ET1]CZR41743.1 uncharacterized protein FPRO_11333 [Fusarium proliferatum ET1]
MALISIRGLKMPLTGLGLTRLLLFASHDTLKWLLQQGADINYLESLEILGRMKSSPFYKPQTYKDTCFLQGLCAKFDDKSADCLSAIDYAGNRESLGTCPDATGIKAALSRHFIHSREPDGLLFLALEHCLASELFKLTENYPFFPIAVRSKTFQPAAASKGKVVGQADLTSSVMPRLLIKTRPQYAKTKVGYNFRICLSSDAVNKNTTPTGIGLHGFLTGRSPRTGHLDSAGHIEPDILKVVRIECATLSALRYASSTSERFGVLWS